MIRLLSIGLALLAVVAIALILRSKWRAPPTRRDTAPDLPLSLMGALMGVLPLPVLAAAIVAMARGLPTQMLGNALGYAFMLLGAWLVWRGLLAERIHARRRIAKTPWPLKGIGSLSIALGTGLTAWLGIGHQAFVSAAFALVALIGCLLFFGRDPRGAKAVVSPSGIDTTDRVVTALTEAERAIAAIEESSEQIYQPELQARLRRIARLGRDILTLLEERPNDLPRARKFLNVYLDGVQRVVKGYARTHERASSPALNASFRGVLESIEEVFTEQHQRLLESDIMDLDVQIEVLNARLRREGLL
jgi:5-bromo-4-chloroindolyl phosphate hydrolysis protein